MFQKYYEMGFVVIPIRPKSKAPVAEALGFDDWALNGQDQKLIEHFDEKYKLENGFGIGIVCGPKSDLAVIDVDTMDSKVLAACPVSPILRRGQGGRFGALMMRYNPEIGNTKFVRQIDKDNKIQVDIISIKKYIIIPPSIHELGFPYSWATEDDFENTSVKDLPILTAQHLRDIEIAVSSGAHYSGSIVGIGGRNDKLKQIASAMGFSGKSEEETVNEVFNYDLAHHNPRLFTDPKEGFGCHNEAGAKQNAFKFVHNVRGTLIKAGKISLVNYSVEIVEPDLNKFKAKDYPEPTGLIKDIRDLTIEYSERFMPNIALGGAVAMMSAICSNRYRFNQCWTNNYVLNLAPTGTGKSYPQKIISKVLDEYLGTQIIGFGNYQSSSAFTKNLVSRRERFDVIDEISSLFAQMKSGGLWQTSILEEMCKTWSSSSGKYNASEYAEKEDTSSCFNPCITILGSSTIEGIKPHISKMMVTKGLIPRFLIFKDEGYGPKSKDRMNDELFNKIVVDLKKILKIERRENTNVKDLICGPLYDPFDIAPIEKDAIEYFEEIKDDFFKRIETEKSAPLQDMLTRGKEHTMKLATVHAAGNFRKINIQDLAWGKYTFEVCLHNAQDFIQETAVDTDWEKDVQAMLNLFKKHPFVTDALIKNRLERLQPQRTKTILEHLLGAEKIVHGLKETKNKKTHGYYFNLTS